MTDTARDEKLREIARCGTPNHTYSGNVKALRAVAEAVWDEAIAAAAQFVGDNAYVIEDFSNGRGAEITAWLLSQTRSPNPYRAVLS